MNLIIDNIDNIIKEKIKIPFNTDYRYCVLFEIMMQDPTISQKNKILQSLELFYPKIDLIKDYKEAIDNIIWYYSGNKEIKEGKQGKIKQIYSYEFDSDYIYSAYMSQYNINLQKAKMNWWEFKALFQGLNETNKIVKIMEYRAMDLSKIKDKEEKAYYKKMKRIYALPDMRTKEQKEADFGAVFWN